MASHSCPPRTSAIAVWHLDICIEAQEQPDRNCRSGLSTVTKNTLGYSFAAALCSLHLSSVICICHLCFQLMLPELCSDCSHPNKSAKKLTPQLSKPQRWVVVCGCPVLQSHSTCAYLPGVLSRSITHTTSPTTFPPPPKKRMETGRDGIRSIPPRTSRPLQLLVPSERPTLRPPELRAWNARVRFRRAFGVRGRGHQGSPAPRSSGRSGRGCWQLTSAPCCLQCTGAGLGGTQPNS